MHSVELIVHRSVSSISYNTKQGIFRACRIPFRTPGRPEIYPNPPFFSHVNAISHSAEMLKIYIALVHGIYAEQRKFIHIR
jgi:hypothetical protein